MASWRSSGRPDEERFAAAFARICQALAATGLTRQQDTGTNALRRVQFTGPYRRFTNVSVQVTLHSGPSSCLLQLRSEADQPGASYELENLQREIMASAAWALPCMPATKPPPPAEAADPFEAYRSPSQGAP